MIIKKEGILIDGIDILDYAMFKKINRLLPTTVLYFQWNYIKETFYLEILKIGLILVCNWP